MRRMKASEADAALGSIRTSLRIYYAENGSYPTQTSYVAVTTIPVKIDRIDMAVKYFPTSAYKYQSVDGISFTIKATGSGESMNINRQMVTDGTLSSF